VRALHKIKPSPENDRLYKPIDPASKDIKQLAGSIKQYGLLQPIRITADGYIISGHRRAVACRLAGLKMVPVQVEPFDRADNPDRFMVLLAEHNRQREKTFDEKLREAVVSVNSDEAHARLMTYREEQSALKVDALDITGKKKRAKISEAKRPLLDAIKHIINRLHLPVSARKIHYKLVELPEPPLIHAAKPDSIYGNDKRSYKALVELLTRARVPAVNEISIDAICDETRPITTWNVYPEAGAFVSDQLSTFLQGYYRNYQQSQPRHIEFLCEKNTAASVFRSICADYCIPMTSGRGYCSLPPRRDLWRRFRKSGKDQLVVLVASDHDPDGAEIAVSFARSMRDDFGIENITAIKVAMTAEQVDEYDVTPNKLEAKQSSANYAKFVKQYGTEVYELEALDDDTLQQLLRDAIDSVMDIDLYNAELDAEASDVKYIEATRKAMLEAVDGIDFGNGFFQ
jgi:hypothetical protein